MVEGCRRRRYIKFIGTAGIVGLAGCESNDGKPISTVTSVNEARQSASIPITGPSTPKMERVDEVVLNFMQKWGVPGGSVAVVKDGRLVFAHGYGYADRKAEHPVQPHDLFRIASASKPITAVAVLELLESGKLHLDDRAFEILNHLVPSGGPEDPRIQRITVRMLLRHTGGWDRAQSGFDPMFNSRQIAHAMDQPPPAAPEEIIKYMMERPIQFDPGTDYAYSNFGYCVLGRIIETVTDQSYGSYVADAILSQMGISHMQLGHTKPDQRPEEEVQYYGNGQVQSIFPEDERVPHPEGGFYLEAMDAHGGWVASPIDLLRFAIHVDGRASVSNTLDSDTINRMTARPTISHWQDTDYYYAFGWYVRPEPNNWWHTGSLPGSSSILVRAGYQNLTWAALFNTRPPDWERFNSEMDSRLWEAVRGVTHWPDNDLFNQFV